MDSNVMIAGTGDKDKPMVKEFDIRDGVADPTWEQCDHCRFNVPESDCEPMGKGAIFKFDQFFNTIKCVKYEFVGGNPVQGRFTTISDVFEISADKNMEGDKSCSE